MKAKILARQSHTCLEYIRRLRQEDCKWKARLDYTVFQSYETEPPPLRHSYRSTDSLERETKMQDGEEIVLMRLSHSVTPVLTAAKSIDSASSLSWLGPCCFFQEL